MTNKMGLGKVKTITNRHYEWFLQVDAERAITIRKAMSNGVVIDGTQTNVGADMQPIQIWAEGPVWFGAGAVIALDDKTYQLYLPNEAYQDGSDWVYTGYIANAQPGASVPAELLLPGRQISRIGGAYPEGSDIADIVNWNSPFKMRNHLSVARTKFAITGDAYSEVMIIELRDKNTGKSTKMMADMIEWRAMRQHFVTKDKFALYSQYNAAPDGTINLPGYNNYPVYIGAGILQQISPANRRYYTKLTMELIDDFLFDMSYNIRGFKSRKYVAFCGEMFMKEFDRCLREKASGYTLIDTKFVTGSGQELTLGGQFVTYKGLNGVELTLKNCPAYDNIVDNRILHPVTLKPAESYRATFLDFGDRGDGPNILKVVMKDRALVMWHVAGSVAPGTGHAKSLSTLRSNAKDGYEGYILSEEGYMIKDPTTCGELILDVAGF